MAVQGVGTHSRQGRAGAGSRTCPRTTRPGFQVLVSPRGETGQAGAARRFLILPLALLFIPSCATPPGPISPARLVPVARQGRRNTCASTCLHVVAGHWGVTTTMAGMERELGQPAWHGYTLGRLRDWARTQDLAAYVVKGTIEDLADHAARKRPVIVVVRSGWPRRNHSMIVTATTDEWVTVMDPRRGRYVGLPAGRFQERWARAGNPMLVVGRGPSFPGGGSATGSVRPLPQP